MAVSQAFLELMIELGDSSSDDESQKQSLSLKMFQSSRINAFDLPEMEFRRLFRLSKELARELCNDLKLLEPVTCRKNALSVESKVLCALRFFATGSYQKSVANDYVTSMSQQSASNCITSVSKAMNEALLQKWIAFPVDPKEQHQIKHRFYEMSGFPGVLGAVDCTHIAIIGMTRGQFCGQDFINQKNFHSINTQIVCDADLRILNINACFPGRTNDSVVWSSSNLYKLFVVGKACSTGNGWLIGDTAYPLEPWLMTPIRNAALDSPQTTYNEIHSKAWSAIKHCNSVLKQRFRCLKDRVLHYAPTEAARIINSCAILHNMCISAKLELEDDDESDEFEDIEDTFNTGLGDTSDASSNQAVIIRNNVITNLMVTP